MYEITINLHMHTRYSDGTGSHAEIAQAALNSNLDAVIVTDHNILIAGKEKVFFQENKKLIMLIGEEIHNQDRLPQKNHLLVIGSERELSHFAHDTSRLIEAVQSTGGLSFIAHPDDPQAKAVGETDITWEDWEINGITGIELWNGFSEFKNYLKSLFHAIYYVFQNQEIPTNPPSRSLEKWDSLLSQGKKIVAIGGSDAHALIFKLGPFRKVVFPYEWHFRMINTHLLLENPLTGDLDYDRKQILSSLSKGQAFIGLDLPASTRGFRFSANSMDGNVIMGGETTSKNGVTFQIRLPRPEECHLIRNGQLVYTWKNQEICSYMTSVPGAYRVESYIHFKGKKRGWIFSNPIYVKK